MKLLKYLSKYRAESVAAPVFKLLECGVDLAVPIITARVIDVGITGVATGIDRGYILRGCALMVLLGLAGLLISVTSQYFSAKAAVGFASELRRAVFSHIQSLDFTARRALGADTLITRITNDINQTQNGLNLFLRLSMRSPFIILGSVVMAFVINRRIAPVFAAAVAALAAVLYIIFRLTAPLYGLAQSKLDAVVGVTRSTLSGTRVIRAFGREEVEFGRFSLASDALAQVQTGAGRLSALTNPLTGVIINISVIAILYLGALEFSSGSITGGAVVALTGYMVLISVELVKFANMTVQITRAVACAGRISALLDTPPALTYPEPGSVPHAAPDAREDGNGCPAAESVRFEGVSLRYAGSGAESLTDISFTVRPGETIGVIGGTGSGKTSLVNLIPRFYDATAGKVYIGGVPVGDLSRAALRAIIGVVPQKNILFTGTIRSNLLWGDPSADDADLWDALERAQAADFVRAKPSGLDAAVEQGGRNFSGGQKQRLTVARAFVRLSSARKSGLPFILILDDSSSALDFATDAALRRALRELPGGATVFIVSQRASSVRSADRILVLDDGRLVGNGTARRACP